MTAFKDVFAALGTALLRPRVLCFSWLLILLPALFAVLPTYVAYDAALAQHPGATFRLDQALDVDFAASHSEATISLLGALVFALLAGAFVSGGVLAVVGVKSTRSTFTEFLGESGRLFLRNLRVLFLGVFVAILLNWGIDALRGWFGEMTYDTDPGATAIPLFVFDVRWAHLFEFGAYLSGFAFLCVVFASKIAMAHLAMHNRRCALFAWGIALGRVARSPGRVGLSVGLLALAWLGGSHGIGMLTAHFLEVRENLWLGLLFGQLSMLWGAAVLVATLLTARAHVKPAATAAASMEPIVEIPRGVPKYADAQRVTAKASSSR